MRFAAARVSIAAMGISKCKGPVNRGVVLARVASVEHKPVNGPKMNLCRLLWVDHGASHRDAAREAVLWSPE